MKISWVNNKLILKNTKTKGKGVFAVRHIKKDELIAVFGGHIVSKSELFSIRKENISAYNVIKKVGYQISDNHIYSPVSEKQFSIAEFLNHSCEPNAGFKNHIELVAIKSIMPGEEINFDYAMCVTSNLFNMKCSCGSIKCRGEVTGHDWRQAALQKKYRPYFQPYIKSKIASLSKSRKTKKV